MTYDEMLDGGYYSLTHLMEDKGYKEMDEFEKDYDIVFNADSDGKVYYQANRKMEVTHDL